MRMKGRILGKKKDTMPGALDNRYGMIILRRLFKERSKKKIMKSKKIKTKKSKPRMKINKHLTQRQGQKYPIER